MAKGKTEEEKTLYDYISFEHAPKHPKTYEFIAFVQDRFSVNSCDRNTFGNKLGETHLGIVVCQNTDFIDPMEGQPRAKFFYKSPPIYRGDKDIVFADFAYKDAKVISEIPLALSLRFDNCLHINNSKGFRKARKLLRKYGLY
jgi:hypothetical protein